MIAPVGTGAVAEPESVLLLMIECRSQKKHQAASVMNDRTESFAWTKNSGCVLRTAGET
jgi:hypothetical protein